MKYSENLRRRRSVFLSVIMPLFIAGAFAASLFSCSEDISSNKAGDETTAVSTIETTVEETRAKETATAIADTETMTEIMTEIMTEAMTEADTSVPVINTPAERDTDFSRCLFIGDSRTEGLMLYSGISGATAYTARGLTVKSYFKLPAVEIGGNKVAISEAVESYTDFDRVYIMLGLNELGWEYGSSFKEAYGQVIDHLRSVMPTAVITVQAIIPVTEEKSSGDEIYNNDNIRRYNGLIKELCEEKSIVYLDLAEILCDGGESLPTEAAFDGVHLKKPYCEKWLDSLKENMKNGG